MFANCSGVVGTIPRDFFNIIPTTDGISGCKLENIGYMFSGTNISGTIPAYNSDTDKGLLDNLPLLNIAGGLFNGCINLVGSIPENLFVNNNRLSQLDSFFSGCNGLSGTIPANLLKGKTQLTTINSMFKNCSGLISNIPIGFLDDCILLNNVASLFDGCIGLYGEIPKRISTWVDQPSKIDPTIMESVENVTQYGLLDKCTNLINVEYLFNNCKGLVSEIPPKLLMNCSKIVSINNLFANCYYIYGPIPDGFLANCRNLQTANSAFVGCVGIYNYIIDEDNPYALPAGLFKDCESIMVSIVGYGQGTAAAEGQPLSRLQTKSTLNMIVTTKAPAPDVEPAEPVIEDK
jgi:hypothetical protein